MFSYTEKRKKSLVPFVCCCLFACSCGIPCCVLTITTLTPSFLSLRVDTLNKVSGKWTKVCCKTKPKQVRCDHSLDVALLARLHRFTNRKERVGLIMFWSVFLILTVYVILHQYLTLFLFILCVHVSLTLKSAAHLPDIPQDVVAGCRERLEQSPCKELFNDCTK